MELFPYSVLRIGGNSFEFWQQLQFPETNARLHEMLLLLDKKKSLQTALCERLRIYIESLDCASHQNLLQNIRRDLYNDRNIKQAQQDKAILLLDDALREQYQAYFLVLDRITILEDAKTFTKELQKNRKVLQSMLEDELFRKGLLLSSRVLLKQIEFYCSKEVSTFGKREFQTEQGALKYITRMCMKTSPFSTFTTIALLNTKQELGKPIAINHANSERNISSHIRLNNYVLKYLLELLKNYKQAYLWFYLRPNPTICLTDSTTTLYLTNHNNIEAFQRIPGNAVIELIRNLALQKEEGIQFRKLIEKLQNEIEATSDELIAYSNQLIAVGFLEFNFTVSALDPDWDLKLKQVLTILADNDVPLIKDIISMLTMLRTAMNQYKIASVKRREEIIEEYFSLYRSVCMDVHEAAGLPPSERVPHEKWQAELKYVKDTTKNKTPHKHNSETLLNEDVIPEEPIQFKHRSSTYFYLKPEQIFYEDTIHEVEASVDETQYRNIITKVNDLLNAMQLFKGATDECDKMKHYFLSHYDEQVDLLTFYEDYYRDFKKPEAQWLYQQKNITNKTMVHNTGIYGDQFSITPTTKDRVGVMRDWYAAYSKQLTLQQHSTDSPTVVHTTLSSIAAVNEMLSITSDNSTTSHSAFLQYYEEDGKLKAVLNSTFPGYGKMMSRFLHILPEEVSAAIRKHNTILQPNDAIFIEDCDASYFNANIHPALLPFEVWMPGGNNTLPAKQQIPITALRIVFHKTKNELHLQHIPTGKRVFVFDLGLQVHTGRSKLFQLLDKFTQAQYLTVQPICNGINLALNRKIDPGEKKSIITLPRILHEQDIIIQRKTWIIPKEVIPLKSKDMCEWKYFIAINQWRREHEIPDEVFVYVTLNRVTEKSAIEKNKRFNRDDYKPQYINFINPLAINLFYKITLKTSSMMKVVEMLPNSHQLIKINGKRYVTEAIAQWHTGKKKVRDDLHR
jgi:hypothetical protein